MDPDINKNTLSTLSGKIIPIIYNEKDLDSKAQKLKKAKTMARVIYNEPPYKVIKIDAGTTTEGLDLAAEAACQYARHTKWCTSEHSKAKGYLARGPLFILFKGNDKVLQTDGREFQNDQGEEIRWTDEILMQLIKSGILEWKAELENKSLYRIMNYYLDVQFHKFPEVTQYLIRNQLVSPGNLLEYAEVHSLPRWPQAEPLIMVEPKVAASYAKYILGHRWIEAEPFIKHEKVAWEQYQKYFKDEFDAGQHDPRDRPPVEGRGVQQGHRAHAQRAGDTSRRVLQRRHGSNDDVFTTVSFRGARYPSRKRAGVDHVR
jgi:hypothetical protein